MVSKASFARVAASILLAMACVGPAWADALVVPEVPSEVIAPTPITPAAGFGLPMAPDWTHYGYAEALIMGRDNQSFNRPLIQDGLSGATLLSTQSLQFPFGPGVRAFYGQVGPDCRGWEIGYFGLYGQTAVATVAGNESLTVPQPLGNEMDPDGADLATIRYSSVINSAEANMFHHFERWNTYRQAWLEVDWLTGFRYIGVEESANIGLVCCDGTGFPAYGVNTQNNMFGGQIGGRARLNWERWALEGWGKAGILGNVQRQWQQPVVDFDGNVIRDATASSGTTAGMVADLNISAIYRLTDVWGIRAGYNTIWLGGVALAPNQFDFAAPGAAGAGTLLQPNGSVFVHGANLGLEARW